MTDKFLFNMFIIKTEHELLFFKENKQFNLLMGLVFYKNLVLR